MAWRTVEPELYLHLDLSTLGGGALDLVRIRQEFLAVAQREFNRFYGFECEIEVEVSEGSLKARIKTTARTLKKILIAYVMVREVVEFGSKDAGLIQSQIREHILPPSQSTQEIVLDCFPKDIRSIQSGIAEQILSPRQGTQEICVQRRVGVIGRIEDTLYEFRDGRIPESEAIQRLAGYFEIIDSSPDRQLYIHEMVQYLNTRYRTILGANSPIEFPWEELEMNTDVVPPRRRRGLNEDDSPAGAGR